MAIHGLSAGFGAPPVAIPSPALELNSLDTLRWWTLGLNRSASARTVGAAESATTTGSSVGMCPRNWSQSEPPEVSEALLASKVGAEFTDRW